MQDQTNQIPIVSVCLITYNHAGYIAQAIDSILSQKTNFEFEILIGEDDSSDGTREKVLDFQSQYPNKIKVFLHSRADVISINGIATGRWNFFDTLSHARGKYVAFLEGDDFWTDVLKLQKQVDVLERHPEFSICAHWTEYVDENGCALIPKRYIGKSSQVVFSIKDVLPGLHLHANSWLFRRINLMQHPMYSLLLKLPGADDSLIWVLLGQGNGYCLNECMSAYRINAGGGWTSKSKCHKQFERVQLRIAALKFVSWTHIPQLVVIIGKNADELILNVVTESIHARSLQAIREILKLNKLQETMSIYSLVFICFMAIIFAPLLLLTVTGKMIKKLDNSIATEKL